MRGEGGGGGLEEVLAGLEKKVQETVKEKIPTVEEYEKQAEKQKMAGELRAGQRAEREAVVRKAFAGLPADSPAKRAVGVLLQSVREDMLPLLSLLQADPFQAQASHLSFQEYLSSKQIEEGGVVFGAGDLPWRWSAAWANVLRLGRELGNGFREGLARASVAGLKRNEEKLDLDGRLVGSHLPTSLGATLFMLEDGGSAGSRLTWL